MMNNQQVVYYRLTDTLDDWHKKQWWFKYIWGLSKLLKLILNKCSYNFVVYKAIIMKFWENINNILSYILVKNQSIIFSYAIVMHDREILIFNKIIYTLSLI